MFNTLALWIDANTLPLLLTGLALHILCGIGIRRGVPIKALIVPSNLGQIIAVIVVAIPFFLPQGGDVLRGALTFTLLWFLLKQNWNFYWQLRDHAKTRITASIAKPTLEMLGHLYASAHMETLDSETPDEWEQLLVKAVRQTFLGTSIFPKKCLWQLKNSGTHGNQIEQLELLVASTVWRKKLAAEDPMLVQKYLLTVQYNAHGAVKELQAKAVGRACGFLKQITGAEGKTYLALRE